MFVGGREALASRRIPQEHRAISMRDCQRLPVRGEDHPREDVVGFRARSWNRAPPVAGSQSRTGSMPLADEASVWLSGEKAMEAINDSWPLRRRTSWPVAGSHSPIVLSSYPAASNFPSGEKASCRRMLLCPPSRRTLLVVCYIPHNGLPVNEAAPDQRLTVGREGEREAGTGFCWITGTSFAVATSQRRIDSSEPAANHLPSGE